MPTLHPQLLVLFITQHQSPCDTPSQGLFLSYLTVQVSNALTFNEPNAKQGAFRGELLLLDMADEHIDDQMGLLINILSKRCQRGMGKLGSWEVIEADHGDVIRHAIVEMIQRLDELSGNTVGGAEECGRRIGTLQQVLQ